MRYYQTAKILSVGLSRLLRAHADIRAVIPELSIVAPATGGLPVAYGICEALRAHQVYWAERQNDSEPLHFREFFELQKGEKVVLVDDVMRTRPQDDGAEETGGRQGRGSHRGRRGHLAASPERGDLRSTSFL